MLILCTRLTGLYCIHLVSEVLYIDRGESVSAFILDSEGRETEMMLHEKVGKDLSKNSLSMASKNI